MKLPGDDGQRPMGFSVVYMVVGVSAFVLIMLLTVMKNNKKDTNGSEYVQNAMQQAQAQEEAEAALQEIEVEPERKLRAEDLDFWDMYPVEGAETENGTAKSKQSTQSETSKKDTEDKKDTQEKKADTEKEDSGKETEGAKKNETVQEDPSTDGRHTLVKAADGTEEWVLISPYLAKNNYDFSNLTESAHLRKYTVNGKKISYVGADISKHNGNVNFNSMKAAGVDFVMLRLGARGYSTGQITLDDNFVENIEAAIEAELDIGIYFYSQAINQEEVNQEANFVVQNLEPYKAHIKYPVAFDMENISNDKARIDGLSREDKTTVTAAFAECMKAAGYTPMIYGNKEWLIKNVDLTKLQDYDIWLSQDEAVPDYPYQYTMWQYTTTGVLNGVQGDASLNICFVSYSDR